MSSDNGGPEYKKGTGGGNNWPLRGGKASNWQGELCKRISVGAAERTSALASLTLCPGIPGMCMYW